MSDETNSSAWPRILEIVKVVGGFGGIIAFLTTVFVWGTAWSDLKHQMKTQNDTVVALKKKVDAMQPPRTPQEARCDMVLDKLANETAEDFGRTVGMQSLAERLDCFPKLTAD